MPLVYVDEEIAKQVAEDPATAEIPDLHKAMYAWVKRFVRNSWELTADDVQALRDAGVDDKEISVWAQIATAQTYLVMLADGGGISLQDGAEVGAVVGRDRTAYHNTDEGLLAGAPGGVNNGAHASDSEIAWIATDTSRSDYERVADWAVNRYGFVPNMLKAVSIEPFGMRSHVSALEVLEAPQSDTLSPRQHALVRALVSELNRCPYSARTTRAMLQQFKDGDVLYEKVTGPWDPDAWNKSDRLVLSFALKATRNAYKIVESDAQGFRDAGLGDEGYIDVLNTVAIQTGLDRMVNSLGVALDENPILATQRSAAA